MNKCFAVMLALLLQGLFTFAQTINVKISPESPTASVIPERAVVPLLKFELTGEWVDITNFVFEYEGSLPNNNFGELVFITDEDRLERGRCLFDGRGFATMRFPFDFTAQKTIACTAWLRAWSDLDVFTGKSISLKLIGIGSGATVTGLPIVGSPVTFTTTPKIGNIVLTAQERSTNGEIFVNVDHQELGRFTADVWDDEDVISKRMTFFFRNFYGESGSISNITLADASGNVLAGPLTPTWYGEDGTVMVTFTNAVTFPEGNSEYRIYGMLSWYGYNHNSLIQVSSPVDLSSWELEGATSGFRIEPWSGDMDFDLVPVNTAQIYAVVTPDGGSITIPQGSTQATIAGLDLMTYGSAEDLLVPTVRFCISDGSVYPNIRNFRLYLGTNCLSIENDGTLYTNLAIAIPLSAPLLIPKDSETYSSIKADSSGATPIGTVFTVNMCDGAAIQLDAIGTVTHTRSEVQIPVQFGSTVTVVPAEAQMFTFNVNLTLGSTGSDVIYLQRFLGITPETGYFGSETKMAVIGFQAANGIPTTGFVGPLTRAALNSMNVAVHHIVPSVKVSRTKAPSGIAYSALTITSEPNTLFEIQSTTDLKAWTTIGAISTDPLGNAAYNDFSAKGHAFYRIVSW